LQNHTIDELNEAVVDFLKNKSNNREDINVALEIIAQFYGISKRTLIKSTDRGKVSVARKMAYIILHFDLGLNTRFIAKRIFDKWQNSVSVAITYYKRLDPSLKQDKIFLDNYEHLQLKIKNKTDHENL
jgi:chromosomal replication initiation ATPase DnaA